MTEAQMSADPNPYFQLIRTNRGFRNLWSAQVVSQLGDWFSHIAIYTLILSLTGSAEAVGLFVGSQFLPAALAGYWTGPITDRFNRRSLMLLTDLLRAGLALCYLLVDRPERVFWVYVITVLMVLCKAIFEPARKSALPDIVSREEMGFANAISGATWSAMLAMGAALGGVVSNFLGAEYAFFLNALSFMLSAFFVMRLTLPKRASKKSEQARWSDCFRYLRGEPQVILCTFCKTLWCLGGGITLVLTLFGTKVFPLGVGGALSIGLFYAFRGLGAGVGPFLAYRVKGHSLKNLRGALFPAFVMGGVGLSLIHISEPTRPY